MVDRGDLSVSNSDSPESSTQRLLTSREREVLQHLANGLSNREIGAKLFVSEETVKSHLRHVKEKLGASNRSNSVAIALRKGLID